MGADGRVGEAGQQAAWELLVDLVTGVVPAAEYGQIYNGELPAELYRLRDALHAVEPILGPVGAAVTSLVGRAIRLLRDEFERRQALQLLTLAAQQLAAIAEVEVPAASRAAAAMNLGIGFGDNRFSGDAGRLVVYAGAWCPNGTERRL